VAVEDGGEREFRRALRERYDASPIFQSLLWQMNWFWGGGSLATAVVTTLFIYLVRNLDSCDATKSSTLLTDQYRLDLTLGLGRDWNCDSSSMGQEGIGQRAKRVRGKDIGLNCRLV
jgi:hypothetical protein